MKKEKQIEEIFNIIVDGVIDGDDNNGMPTGNTCVNIAKDIYNAGYRKVSENYIGTDEILRSIDYRPTEEVRKETAKEFAEKLKKRTILYSGINVKYEAITADIIDELLKEYEE